MPKYLSAFTLAEVLITLAIIGVVAALTIPTLIKNYQKHETVVKLKKAYTVLNQAFIKTNFENGANLRVMPSTANGVKQYFENNWLQYFSSPKVVPNGVAPYSEGAVPYKHYQNNHIRAHQYYEKRTFFEGNIKRIFFETGDGILYFILAGENVFCGNNYAIFVDLNNYKKPNFLGKDVFIFCTDFDKKRIKAYGSSWYCRKDTVLNESSQCASKIIRDGWRIKADYLL